MPMGMLTPVGASASVTSGGESQRIVIARALLRSPRILLLDEATNWLDNDSQARIMDDLAVLTSTRIVIAHRLSTLRHADRIYVMRSGKVVQEGSFAKLASDRRRVSGPGAPANGLTGGSTSCRLGPSPPFMSRASDVTGAASRLSRVLSGWLPIPRLFVYQAGYSLQNNILTGSWGGEEVAGARPGAQRR